ncbi:hypothetical protein ColTof4_04312 [Colletotrichum tofieldiae]|nr:hypothetical protein ColTof3_14161 [Colletotrichum tofieldiae]GKT71889.1 hypothetical protein ColTof4_04312 [Colletotrichum tofieldiae]
MRLSKQPQAPEYQVIDASSKSHIPIFEEAGMILTSVVLAGAADTKKKPFRAQLYSIIALLVVTLGLIAVGVLLNRKLPAGSESQFVFSGTGKAVASAANKRELSQREKAIKIADDAVLEMWRRQLSFPEGTPPGERKYHGHTAAADAGGGDNPGDHDGSGDDYDDDDFAGSSDKHY